MAHGQGRALQRADCSRGSWRSGGSCGCDCFWGCGGDSGGQRALGRRSAAGARQSVVQSVGQPAGQSTRTQSVGQSAVSQSIVKNALLFFPFLLQAANRFLGLVCTVRSRVSGSWQRRPRRGRLYVVSRRERHAPVGPGGCDRCWGRRSGRPQKARRAAAARAARRAAAGGAPLALPLSWLPAPAARTVKSHEAPFCTTAARVRGPRARSTLGRPHSPRPPSAPPALWRPPAPASFSSLAASFTPAPLSLPARLQAAWCAFPCSPTR